jgi:putative hemolysin
MTAQATGRLRARFSEVPEDIEAAQRLRHEVFIAPRLGARADGVDADAFDPLCTHALIEEVATGRLVCCFRMMHLADGSQIARSYSAQHYELSGLLDYPSPMVEMGRFCARPGYSSPDVLRVAWGAMSDYVDANGVGLLFGCSSFDGVDEAVYMDAFAYLRARHLAPTCWQPRVKSPSVFSFATLLGLRRPDMRLAMKRMPPLLRTYLTMGGWVSDHAVIDRDLNTLHVFTGVEIDRVPAARRRQLRAAPSQVAAG